MSGVVAIHQPNFFPWLGYFDKIRRADIFVLLDAVDYPRAGSGGMGSWTNRVQLNIQGEARWVTCPLKRVKFGTSILDVVIDDSRPWRSKILKTLEANYRRAPRYENALALLSPILQTPQASIAEFNIQAITAIAAYLGLSTPLVRQSALSYEGKATDLLISLVKTVGGDSYMVGGGAAAYQQDELFAVSGIRIVPQKFTPRVYGDPKRFLPGLSVIDYLMQDGRPLADAFQVSC